MCGNGVSCNGVCGKESDHAVIIASNDPSKNWCRVTNDFVHAPFPLKMKTPYLCIPLHNLWFYRYKVKTVRDINTYPVCCLHPYVYNNVPGVPAICCNYGLCFG